MATLVQTEADGLRTMPKRFTRAGRAEFGMPSAGDGRTFQLESLGGSPASLIDVTRRGKIKRPRCWYWGRYRVRATPAGLDIDGPPHTNPPGAVPPLMALAAHIGVTIACPHFHYYVEGF